MNYIKIKMHARLTEKPLHTFLFSLAVSEYQHLFSFVLEYLKGTTSTCVFIPFILLENKVTCLLGILIVGVLDNEYKNTPFSFPQKEALLSWFARFKKTYVVR